MKILMIILISLIHGYVNILFFEMRFENTIVMKY